MILWEARVWSKRVVEEIAALFIPTVKTCRILGREILFSVCYNTCLRITGLRDILRMLYAILLLPVVIVLSVLHCFSIYSSYATFIFFLVSMFAFIWSLQESLVLMPQLSFYVEEIHDLDRHPFLVLLLPYHKKSCV
ncbi:hypothetical protein DPMN_160511 [Dreissena polymorpha]|uniref:Uncharacterized protein n=1 Tax=Dreissena polymorpha TaxID=45954 RepID=A0A9D4ENA7_DREPO|nr:hypothetical protein DPMN_160511 [Dreissena polymorpha]